MESVCWDPCKWNGITGGLLALSLLLRFTEKRDRTEVTTERRDSVDFFKVVVGTELAGTE